MNKKRILLFIAFLFIVTAFVFAELGIKYFFYVIESYILLMYLYIYFPVLISFVFAKRLKEMRGPLLDNPTIEALKFKIIIPAHNEELLIRTLLESINHQLYPSEKFETWVIADNCTDNTAKIALECGVTCFERNTGQLSSKGEALQFAAEMLGLTSREGYVILIDADCQLQPNFLYEVSKKLKQPNCASILQTYRFVQNKYTYIVSILDSASEAIRQWVTLGSRKVLGLNSFILGSGVVFSTPLFLRLTENHHGGFVEDKEWNAELLKQNVKIDWCPSARLSYEVVENNSDFQKQRKRWINGQFELARKHFFSMFFGGIRKADFSQIDFSISLIQLPRSALMIFTFILIVASGFMSSTMLPYWFYILLFLSLVFYGFLGLLLIQAEKKYYMKMIFGSIMILGLTRSTISSLFGKKEKKWDPTNRATAMTKK